MIETLKTLCALPGVSGNEDAVRDYIKERVAPYADEIKTDVMGNLLVFKRGAVTPARRLMLCAHMDEIGIIITGVSDTGYLRFDFVGGVDRRVAIGKWVSIGPKAVPGVIGIKAYHLVDKDEETKVPKTEALYIDIGAADKDEALRMVSLGDTGIFDAETIHLGSELLAARAIDDRLGCAAMVRLLEESLPCDCHFVFSVQEEIGCRGAAAAAYAIAPDVALILEGTTAADLPGVEEKKRICSVGGGIVIPFIDNGTLYDRGLYALLTGLAEKNGIKWQTKQAVSGGTDASVIQRSRSGVKTAGIACALRNVHAPACIGKRSEFEDLLALARLFIEKAAENRI